MGSVEGSDIRGSTRLNVNLNHVVAAAMGTKNKAIVEVSAIKDSHVSGSAALNVHAASVVAVALGGNNTAEIDIAVVE